MHRRDDSAEDEDETMFRNILVPVDGGDLSDSTVQRACAFAQETGAHLVFFHAVAGFYPTFVAGEAVVVDYDVEETLRAARDQQAQALLDAAAQHAGSVGVACVTERGEADAPYEGIIAAAKAHDCDLIFMASHGRRGARALLLGSETQKVLTHCDIPVLVYR